MRTLVSKLITRPPSPVHFRLPGACEAGCGLGIVGRQVNGGRLPCEGADPLVGESLGGLVGADAVDNSAKQRVLGVGVGSRGTN